MKKLQKGTSNKLSIVPAAVSDRIDNPRWPPKTQKTTVPSVQIKVLQKQYAPLWWALPQVQKANEQGTPNKQEQL
jgi:hypothetical protein